MNDTVTARITRAVVEALEAEALDWSYIEDWCTKHGTTERMTTVRDSIPPI